MMLLLVLLTIMMGSTNQPGVDWRQLAPGMELGWMVARSPSPVGDSRIAIVRIDPTMWQLDLLGRSRSGEPKGLTARQWAQSHGLSVAINAGMFDTSYVTHVGYMECRGHVNSGDINGYRSVAAFDPREPSMHAPFRIFDLDADGVTIQSIRRDYASLVQNLRLVKRPGQNRWGKKDSMWSEAALGEDREGKVLFVVSRSPFTMPDLNRELLSAGIGLVALQHLEGGPEAQLYLHVGDTEIELVGSYESSFNEDDGNPAAWPIPNVLGVRPRTHDD